MHARGIPSLAILYYHPVNIHRLGKVKNDRTPEAGANHVGKHASFARAFRDHGVPFVNTSILNEAHGWRAMLNTTRGILSAAHLSPIGHHGVARLLLDLLTESPTTCATAFRLPPLDSTTGPAHQREYFCRIGQSLRASVLVTNQSRGAAAADADDWQVVAQEGRTPGLRARHANVTSLRLAMPVPAPGAGRFLSLGFERSFRNQASARISCHGGCICAPNVFDAHTSKRYSYLQRTTPRWVTAAAGGGSCHHSETSAANTATADRSSPGGGSSCEVHVEVTRLEAGRLMLKALTLSTPRAGNKSVSVNSLYSLP